QEREKDRRGVKARWDFPKANATEKRAEAGGAVENSCKQQTGKKWAEEHDREHHQAGEFWDLLTAQEARGYEEKCAEPGNCEREGETGCGGMATEDGRSGNGVLIHTDEECLWQGENDEEQRILTPKAAVVYGGKPSGGSD